MFAAGESVATIASAGLLSVMMSMVAVTFAWLSPLILLAGFLVGLWAIFKYGERVLTKIRSSLWDVAAAISMFTQKIMSIPVGLKAWFTGLETKMLKFIDNLPKVFAAGGGKAASLFSDSFGPCSR